LTLNDVSLVWPVSIGKPSPSKNAVNEDILRSNRIYDRDILNQFYPKLVTFQSKELGIYWRGPIELIDGTELEVIVVEDASGSEPRFTAMLRNPPKALAKVVKAIGKKEFSSCRVALITTERICNTELFERHRKGKWRGLWMF